MTNKAIKEEERRKLALNMHQAVVLYAIIFVLTMTLVALIIAASILVYSANVAVAVVLICYGVILLLVVFIGSGMIGYAMSDYYLATYKCKPYNIRRLGDTLARSGVSKILVLNIKRILIGFLLLLCLIVPGVIYLIRTSMANNLLIANPKMKVSTALSASNKVMSGKTGSYFSLIMSMFGWIVLGVLTLGVGFIFVLPYINLAKTVYYKRNLQGDRTVYQTVVQPLSPPQPVISQPGQVAPQQQVRTTQPVVPPQQQTSRPIDIQPDAGAPIDTLGAADVAEMNAAMRDLEKDVPEIPLTPIANPKSKPRSSKSIGNTGNTQAGEFRIEDSDIVEIVKPLTTREVEESDVMGKQINSMFSKSKPKEEENRDYMSFTNNQNPNDFVTSEYQPGAGEAPFDEPKNEDITDSVMSDKEFADFIRSFDVPEPKPEFKPLTRSTVSKDMTSKEPPEIAIEEPATASDDFDAAPQNDSAGFATAGAAKPASRASARQGAFATPRTAARPSASETQRDRLRREREEHLKNLRK